MVAVEGAKSSDWDPSANLFGLVISAHSGFRIELFASLTTHILGLKGW
jgi:hypothetical protein